MKFKIVKTKLLSELKQAVKRSHFESEEASSYVNQILEGNLNASISDQMCETKLGHSLASLQAHLKSISQSEQERNWLNVGLAKFSDLLRNKDSLDLKNLADTILTNMVNYVDANQGAMFTYEEVKGDEHLQMLACYAYSRKKFLNKRINIGDGLVGQCVMEKDTIYIKKAPANYVSITSGLGEAVPREILITPMSINDKVFGVIELASFNEFSQHKIDFIKKLSENIASTIKTVRENERVVALLNSSQQQAEELRAQEEEMRQNMEELQAIQEEMLRKNNEIVRTSAEMVSIARGINSTMATIEFTPDGIVIAANSNFLQAMKYKLEEIKGKHHRLFVPSEIVASEEYQNFWNRLAVGESFTGVFKRISSDKNVVWLNAIYNPILNEKEEVIKVVKYATNITQQQELLAETKGILKGINVTMSTIEFTPQGIVVDANENFLKTMNYTIDEIRGKHHRIFVPDELLHTDDYRTFWQRLADGESMTGKFKRKNSEGKTVWLSAIYNPIFNANGDVSKIIKFATNSTAD